MKATDAGSEATSHHSRSQHQGTINHHNLSMSKADPHSPSTDTQSIANRTAFKHFHPECLANFYFLSVLFLLEFILDADTFS